MTDLQRKQVPFATALALNDTAQDVDTAWQGEMRRSLDRPTPFTMRGIFRSRASKTRLTTTVGFKSIQAEYLKRQVTGGARFPKRRALLMPVGQRLNKYGNMVRGSVAKTVAKPDTFVASAGGKRTSHLAPGIYKRPKYSKYRNGGNGNKNRGIERGPQLLVSFKGRADYSKRLHLKQPAETQVRTQFPRHFAVRLAAAIKTAR